MSNFVLLKSYEELMLIYDYTCEELGNRFLFEDFELLNKEPIRQSSYLDELIVETSFNSFSISIFDRCEVKF
jgi:hypothetical protein